MTKSKFRPQTKNVNRHTVRGIGLLEKSVQRDGWIDAMTATADGEVISGSARIGLAEEKFEDVEPIVVESDGTRPVIVKRTDIPNAGDPRALRLAVAANQVTTVDWNPDPDVLEGVLADDSIAAMFTGKELADVFRDVEDNVPIDEIAEQNAELGGRAIPEMELQAFEHYDYIILVFRNQLDFIQACTLFGVAVAKVIVRENENPDSRSVAVKFGLGRCVEGAKVIEMLAGKLGENE